MAGKEASEINSEDLHIKYPATNGSIVEISDPFTGKRYIWKETKVIKIKPQNSKYMIPTSKH